MYRVVFKTKRGIQRTCSTQSNFVTQKETKASDDTLFRHELWLYTGHYLTLFRTLLFLYFEQVLNMVIIW